MLFVEVVAHIDRPLYPEPLTERKLSTDMKPFLSVPNKEKTKKTNLFKKYAKHPKRIQIVFKLWNSKSQPKLVMLFLLLLHKLKCTECKRNS